MIIIEFKYINTMDEYLNGYKLMTKLRKSHFIIYHVLPKILVVPIVISIIYSFKIAFKETYLNIFSIQPFLSILVSSFLLYELFTAEKGFLRSIEKKLKAKFGEFKEVICKVEENRFLCEQGNNRTEVLFDQIYKVVENNNAIYIFGDEYLILLIIPTNVFKNSEEKNEFMISLRFTNNSNFH